MVALISLFFLFWTGVANASEILPMVDGADLSWLGSLGTGSNDYFGFSGDLLMGSDLDPKAVTGDFHANYLASFAPQDPTNPESPSKRQTFWDGGVAVYPWNHGMLGLDYDSSADPYETLYSEGIRLSVGHGPLNASYRFARTTIQTDFSVQQKNPKKPALQYDGAFIYQQTIELGGKVQLSKPSSLSMSASYSFFHPDVDAFMTLLSRGTMASLTNLQSEIQNFSLWNGRLSWREKWNRDWDSRVSGQYVHLVVGNNPLLLESVESGYHWSDSWYTKLGVQYSHDPTDHILSVYAEVRFSWDRESEEPSH